MAYMSPHMRMRCLQFLSLWLIFVLMGPAACNVDRDPSEVNGVRSNELVSSASQYTMASASRGFKTALIHRDHYSLRRSAAETDKNRSPAEILGNAARQSLKHGESLRSGHGIKNERRLAENAPSRSQGVDWETQLSVQDSNHQYLMGVSLGTPPQTFLVEADTGSDLAWIQCLPNKGFYNQSSPPFDPSKSSTYAKLSCASSACEFLSTGGCEYSSSASEGSDCGYTYSYGDSSITNGTLAEDTIYVGTLAGGVQSVSKFWFGCSNNATDGFGGADGLFGLGRGEISFPSQLGRYFGSVFSYCLVNRSRNELETSPLIFGDDALSATAANGSRLQLQFTPMVNLSYDKSFYWVDVEGIAVNGVPVSIPKEAFAITEDGGGGTIFDSGTPITRLVNKAFDPLLETLSNAITHYKRLNDSALTAPFELCYNASLDTWISEYGKKVPPVSFNFANASTFDLAAGNMWYEIDEGILCMAILRLNLSGISNNIFGNIQQADHYIVYDLENQRFGFATTVCEN